MKTKQTLKLKKSTIEKEEIEITPLVKSLTGVVSRKAVKKDDYTSFLHKKYK